MRIGLFTDQYYPIISGVSTSIKMLYEGLTDLGHECFIFTCMDNQALKKTKEFDSKNIINIPGRPYPLKNIKDYRYTFFHRKYVKIIKQYNLDIIHVHTEYNIAKLAIRAGKKLHIPIVHTFHTLWEEYFSYISPFFDTFFHSQMRKGLVALFTGPLAKASTYEIVPTKKVLALSKLYGLSKDIKVIPTGIDLEVFRNSKYTQEEIDSLKNKLGIDVNDFVYIYLGRLSVEKNISTIIKAFSKIENRKGMKLVIVGGGPLLNELKTETQNLNCTNEVIFTDMVPWDDVPLYYHIADVFVNASVSETQGLTYIEALASNLPVLVQIDSCLEDVVIEGYNGFYFDGEEELSEMLEKLPNERKIVSDVKKNTSKSIRKYTKGYYAANILKVYNDAIAIKTKKNCKKKA